MIVHDIYDQYKIMPNLAQHMYRVAGVGDWIAAKLALSHAKVSRENVVKTCLVHDLGNIVKFDLAVFPEYVEPEGLDYWQSVKTATTEKYGKNAHLATNAMIRELGLSERLIELADAISFNRAKQTLEGDDWDAKICAYADMRVAPHGVVSMKERLEDGFQRYEKRGADRRFSYIMGSYLRKIEQQLAEAGRFQPEEIREESIKKEWEKMVLVSST